MTTFASRLPEGVQDFGLALGIGLILFALFRLVFRVWSDLRDEQRAKVPDWRIGEAMDYIADRLNLTSEQDIESKYINPARLLTRQARVGKFRVWGKRISSHGPELDRQEFPPEVWRNRELVIWACQPYIEKPQTRSVIDSPDVYQLTDLHVNSTEIKAIAWHGDA